ncbi:hypothetical protein [Lactococcus lactis]|uniref:hypothetical protein n=1 Tax=Lactococcus lactis TaxID=1358 RepID=UPI000E6CA670|nr:hypothetical protein [Lactococcus lactis]RJK92249.1 hypothetical protein D4M07_01400 [Lactococcus lactis subsp. lactis]
MVKLSNSKKELVLLCMAVGIISFGVGGSVAYFKNEAQTPNPAKSFPSPQSKPKESVQKSKHTDKDTWLSKGKTTESEKTQVSETNKTTTSSSKTSQTSVSTTQPPIQENTKVNAEVPQVEEPCPKANPEQNTINQDEIYLEEAKRLSEQIRQEHPDAVINIIKESR